MIQNYLSRFNPRRAFVPGAVAYECGAGIQGKRALVVASTRIFGDPAFRIIKPAIRFGDGFEVLSGLDRLNRLINNQSEDDAMSAGKILGLFPIWEQFKPHNLEIQLNEVDILPRNLQKEYIPRVAQQFGLVLEWTSKSHPLRTLGLPSVLDIAGSVMDYTRVCVHRAFRELRSVLKNGLPLEEPEPGEFGDILRTVTIGVVPMRGERTDLIHATPRGARRLRFIRRFEGEEHQVRWFVRDAERYEKREERVGGRVQQIRQTITGHVVYSPETLVKLVTVEGVKGMCTMLPHDVQVNGIDVDLLVDVRSVISKGAQLLLEGDSPFWTYRTMVGATDHGTPMHREQVVSVRPEAALFAGLADSIDPVEHLQDGLVQELDTLWRMAHQLGLDMPRLDRKLM